MYSFEKRSTIINVQFWKTLYNDQCTVLKNALQWSMFFLKNALQWSLYCFEKNVLQLSMYFFLRFTMIIVLFWKTLYNDQCSVVKDALQLINVLFFKNPLQWSMYCFWKTLHNDQCTVLKNALQWSMYSFEKRSTIINVLFWKTLYNDQCTVLKNALQ